MASQRNFKITGPPSEILAVMCSNWKAGEEKLNLFLFYLIRSASIGATFSEGSSELANQASLSQGARLLYHLKFVPFLPPNIFFLHFPLY